MDKNEFNIRAERIRKLTEEGDYRTAMQIADSIDWNRVRNANLLSSIADIYERNGEYQEARDILMLAYDRAPVGKRFLFRLSEISVKEGDLDAAMEFYRDFCELSPEDPRQYLLRYMILKKKGAKPEQLIGSLEQYSSEEVDEKWLYELAKLYADAEKEAECIRTCDKIMLLFGLGKYVDKAMELKRRYQPLTKEQLDLEENREKYEDKLRQVSMKYEPNEDYDLEGADFLGNNAVPEAAEPVSEEEAKKEMAAAFRRPNEQREKEESPEEEAVIEEREGEDESGAPSKDEKEEEEAESAEKAEDSPKKQPPEREAEDEEEREEPSAPLSSAREPEKSTGETEETPEEEIEEIDSGEPEEEKHNYHMIIEAASPEDGFRIAVDEIRFFHKKYGLDYKVAKTTAEKLNEKGFKTFLPRLRGRDLIIEHAGELKYSVVDEISEYLDQLSDSASVVLVDLLDAFDRMAEDRPLFIRKFDLVSDKKAEEEEEEKEELLEDVDLNAEPKEEKEPEKTEEEKRPTRPYDRAEEKREIEVFPQRAERSVQREKPAEEERPRVPLEERAAENEHTRRIEKPEESGARERRTPEQYRELSIDEFAEYAQEYARSIDCVMPGKTVIALYERIELMQEDGIPLNKQSAEELIEEAADRAEKPSIGKKLSGMFHPKYDKNDKLILREENFIS